MTSKPSWPHRLFRIRLLGTEVLAVELGERPPPPKEEPPKGIGAGSGCGTERAWSPELGKRPLGFGR